jgi:hypothetical protein
MSLNDINLIENNIKIKKLGSQIIITDGEYMISKLKGTTYITYIGDNNGPEKVLLNIPEKGYYEISYTDELGFAFKNVPKPVNNRKDK